MIAGDPDQQVHKIYHIEEPRVGAIITGEDIGFQLHRAQNVGEAATGKG
jgi:hypothetical protein